MVLLSLHSQTFSSTGRSLCCVCACTCVSLIHTPLECCLSICVMLIVSQVCTQIYVSGSSEDNMESMYA